MRALLSLFLVAFPLTAQFSNLATDDAGSRVWFSSALRLRGTQQNLYPKIFVADALGNVQLVAQVTSSDPYSLLTHPEVSGDGSVLAYLAGYNCLGQIYGGECHVVDGTEGVVSMAKGPLTMPGIFHLSRNGRYVVREGYNYSGPTGQLEIIDLTTQQKREVLVGNFQEIAGGGRQVTSVGAVLAYADGLWLFQPDGSAQIVLSNFTIPSPGEFFSFSGLAAVDDSGAHIVYQATTLGCEIDLTAAGSSAEITTLAQSDQPCTMETLATDGTTVLFVSPANFDGSNSAGTPQCWIVDTTSKAIRSPFHDAAGIAEAVLSGNGNVIWAVDLAGQLWRGDLSNTGTAKTVIPQTVAVDQNALSYPIVAAPGALVHLTGRGLAAQSATSTLPLATTVGGVQLLADGQPLPLLSVAPADIVFQVPWDMQGTHTLTLAATQSPFEEALSRGLETRPSAPVFWLTADGFPVIAHQDFHGLVSVADPAHPDEILHFYLTGMGAVTPAVGTGQPAPLAPLSFMRDPVFVSWAGELPFNFPLGAKVLFAGLAPGLVGLEQIDVQVPHEAPAQLSVNIGNGQGGAASAAFPIAP